MGLASPIDLAQRKTSLLTPVDEPRAQAALPLLRKADPNWEPVEKIRACKSEGRAFSLACASSGLEDKEICGGLEVDAGYFSRMKAGKAALSGDKVALFCEIVGNRIYPEWLAYQVGCTLVEIETETQRQLRVARDELEEERRTNRVLMKALQGKG